MHRILAENTESRERRNQLRHPRYEAPQLLATKPNELWSWDITKLLGPQKWTYYYLYVLLDVFSRYAVGWLLADRESGVLAKKRYQRNLAELKEHLRSAQKIIVDITNAQRKQLDEEIATGQWTQEDAYEFGQIPADEEHV
ncbi:MAG: transposase family protein, partial [Myxococcota bacterium]